MYATIYICTIGFAISVPAAAASKAAVLPTSMQAIQQQERAERQANRVSSALYGVL
jgi:hypothetical protein